MAKRPAVPRLVSTNDQVANVIRAYKSREHIGPFEIFKALALIVRTHKEFSDEDDSHAVVPVDLLYAIGSYIGEQRKASATARKKRSTDTTAEHEAIRLFATEMRQRTGLSDNAIARHMKKNNKTRLSQRTIRAIIPER